MYSVVGVFASLTCALTWAFASVILANLLQKTTTTPVAIGLVKAIIATPMLLAAGLALGDGFPRMGDHLGALVVSAVLGMVIADSAYMATLKRLGVARAVFVIPLVPFVTALFAMVGLHETLAWPLVIGGLITLAGVVLAVRTDGVSSAKVGVAGVVVAAAYVLSQAASNVVLKGVLADTQALHIATVRIAMGGCLFLPLTMREGGWRPLLTRPHFAALLMAVVVGTFAGMWLGTVGTQRLPVAVATTLAATTPVWALVISRLRGEALSSRSAVGAVLALVGVALMASTV